MATRVFVSSTFSDLENHRGAVRDVIRRLDAEDKAMELLGARDERPRDECVRLLREETDLFVGIYAHRYGFIPDGDRVSITETEYLTATEFGTPRFVFLVDEKNPWRPDLIERGDGETKLAAFKKRLRANHVCESFTDPDDLAKRVATSLGRHMSKQRMIRVDAPNGREGTAGLVPRTIEQWTSSRDGIYADCRGFFLVHTLTRSTKPGQEFDIQIYLVRHQSEDFTSLKFAEFFLGRYWGNRVFRVDNHNDGEPLGIRTAAYGTFLCICKLHFTDGSEAMLSRYIDFEAAATLR